MWFRRSSAIAQSFSHPSSGWPIWLGLAALWMLWRKRQPDLATYIRDATAMKWTAVALLAICLGVWVYCRMHHVNPLWVPRYLGVAWPALAIGTCALLRQIRWKWLGNLAFIGLLTLNLIHVVGNLNSVVFEMPRNRLAADVIAAQGPRATLRVYTGPRILESPDEETGRLQSNPSTRYYLLRAAGRTMSLSDFHDLPLADWPWLHLWTTVEPAKIADDVARDPQLNTLIVWELLPKTGPIPSTQASLDALGPRWTCQADEIIIVRKNWGLGVYNRIRRAVYRRRSY